MKTTTYLAMLVFVSLVSGCKKDITCTCTTTNTNTYIDGQGKTTITVGTPSKETRVYKEASKKDLKTVCGDMKFSNDYVSTSASSTTSYKSVTETTCEIK